MGNAETSGKTVKSSFDSKPVPERDPWLKTFLTAIAQRYGRFSQWQWKDTINQYEGGYDTSSKGYEKFGFNIDKDGSIIYREWAPNANEAALIGDFSKPLANFKFAAPIYELY